MKTAKKIETKTIRLWDKTYLAIKKIAKKEKITISEVIEGLLAK